MPEEKKLTSQEWYSIIYPNKEVVIMDPDGWDRQNFKYSWFEELITLNGGIVLYDPFVFNFNDILYGLPCKNGLIICSKLLL